MTTRAFPRLRRAWHVRLSAQHVGETRVRPVQTVFNLTETSVRLSSVAGSKAPVVRERDVRRAMVSRLRNTEWEPAQSLADGPGLDELPSALSAAGAGRPTPSRRASAGRGRDRDRLSQVQSSLWGGPSAPFDAVAIQLGPQEAEAIAARPKAQAFLRDAFAHPRSSGIR